MIFFDFCSVNLIADLRSEAHENSCDFFNNLKFLDLQKQSILQIFYIVSFL